MQELPKIKNQFIIDDLDQKTLVSQRQIQISFPTFALPIKWFHLCYDDTIVLCSSTNEIIHTHNGKILKTLDNSTYSEYINPEMVSQEQLFYIKKQNHGWKFINWNLKDYSVRQIKLVCTKNSWLNKFYLFVFPAQKIYCIVQHFSKKKFDTNNFVINYYKYPQERKKGNFIIKIQLQVMEFLRGETVISKLNHKSMIGIHSRNIGAEQILNLTTIEIKNNKTYIENKKIQFQCPYNLQSNKEQFFFRYSIQIWEIKLGIFHFQLTDTKINEKSMKYIFEYRSYIAHKAFQKGVLISSDQIQISQQFWPRRYCSNTSKYIINSLSCAFFKIKNSNLRKSLSMSYPSYNTKMQVECCKKQRTKREIGFQLKYLTQMVQYEEQGQQEQQGQQRQQRYKENFVLYVRQLKANTIFHSEAIAFFLNQMIRGCDQLLIETVILLTIQ